MDKKNNYSKILDKKIKLLLATLPCSESKKYPNKIIQTALDYSSQNIKKNTPPEPEKNIRKSWCIEPNYFDGLMLRLYGYGAIVKSRKISNCNNSSPTDIESTSVRNK